MLSSTLPSKKRSMTSSSVERLSDDRFQFIDLSEDCIISLFEYLPISIRISLEKVNSTFQEASRGVDRREKAIAFVPRYGGVSGTNCGVKDHHVPITSVVPIGDDPERIIKILSRFENLRVFIWCSGLKLYTNPPSTAGDVALALSKSCTKLEHVYCEDARPDGFFSGLHTSSLRCMECLQLPEKALTASKLTFLSCVDPGVEILSTALATKVSKLVIKDHHYNDHDISRMVETISANGAHLEALSYRDRSELPGHLIEQLCRALPNLKHLEMVGRVSSMQHLTKLKKLESLTWFGVPRSYWYDVNEAHSGLFSALAAIGSRMKKLYLDLSGLDVDDIRQVVGFCPNLTELSLTATFPDFDDSAFGPIAQLKHLRRMIINRHNITVQGVSDYLEATDKLREFRFQGFSNHDDHDELIIIRDEYRRRHPKRAFNLIW